MTVLHVVNAEVFRSILIGRRKRADRSGRPFLLALLSVKDARAERSSSTWEAALDALAAVKRDTDVLGWFERRSVLGLILPEISPAEVADVRAGVAAAIRRELTRRVGPASAASVRIRVQVHPEPNAVVDGAEWIEPLLYPELWPRPARRATYEAIKRTLDVVLSAALLLVLSPLLLVIAVLVKRRSPGPVFFGQVRIGHRMKPFRMLKFRTMHVGADPRIHQEFVSRFINNNNAGGAHGAETNGGFKLTDDPRVTPVGRWLRRTSLDELPQLWNVLRGDMSLVGPRPPLRYELEQYKPWHRRRVLEAKPGMTGLWQVAGRSRTTFDEMVRLDLRYVRSRSLWTDVKILLATPAAVISGKGAR